MGQDQIDQPLPLWLTLQAATKLVSISESTLRRLIKAGKIRSRKCGKRRLVETPSLLAFFDQLPE